MHLHLIRFKCNSCEQVFRECQEFWYRRIISTPCALWPIKEMNMDTSIQTVDKRHDTCSLEEILGKTCIYIILKSPVRSLNHCFHSFAKYTSDIFYSNGYLLKLTYFVSCIFYFSTSGQSGPCRQAWNIPEYLFFSTGKI